MSNIQWFYADAQQKQQGPVTFEQIQQLAASGQIQPATLIWNEGMANWTAASQVQGVFNPGAVQAAPAQVPAPAQAQANPYAAPTSGSPLGGASAGGGDYPIPQVKKCSYPLYLVTFLVGIILYFAAIGIFAVTAAKAASELEQERSVQPAIETVDDLEDFKARQQADAEAQAEKLMEELPVFVIALGGVGMLLTIISGILSLICLYRAWSCVQPGGARTTPGKAVGFLFIPFFNIYWMFVAFYGWAQDWTRIQASYGNLAGMPRVSTPLFLTALIMIFCAIIPFLGLIALLAYPILYLIMMAQMYKVVNAMAAASRQGF